MKTAGYIDVDDKYLQSIEREKISHHPLHRMARGFCYGVIAVAAYFMTVGVIFLIADAIPS